MKQKEIKDTAKTKDIEIELLDTYKLDIEFHCMIKNGKIQSMSKPFPLPATDILALLGILTRDVFFNLRAQGCPESTIDKVIQVHTNFLRNKEP
jgi:hypothetical protein